MKKLNVFTTGFPGTNKTLRFINDMAVEQRQSLAKVCGDKSILSGLEIEAGVISSGVISYNGDLITFEGGALGPNVEVITQVENANYNTDPSNGAVVASHPAYENTIARCTEGAGDFPFEDLRRMRPFNEFPAYHGQLTTVFNGFFGLVELPFPDLGHTNYSCFVSTEWSENMQGVVAGFTVPAVIEKQTNSCKIRLVPSELMGHVFVTLKYLIIPTP